MKKSTQFAIVMSVLCGSVPPLAVEGTRAIRIGGGGNDDALNPNDGSWLQVPALEG